MRLGQDAERLMAPYELLPALTSCALSLESGVPEEANGDTRENDSAIYATNEQQSTQVHKTNEQANKREQRASPPG